jgi:uncharacterized protein YndB with AHSA1/START domain
MSDRFMYATYIRTTPEKLWDALLKPEFTKLYWFGATLQSEWKQGAPWQIVFADGRIADAGENVEIETQKRIVIKWRNEFMPEMKAEGYSRCTIEIEPAGDAVKLTVVHEIDKTGSKFIQAVSGGWPKILSGLKSLLETGKPLEIVTPGAGK